MNRKEKYGAPRSWRYLFAVLISPVMLTNSSLVHAHSKKFAPAFNEHTCSSFPELGQMMSAARTAALRHF